MIGPCDWPVSYAACSSCGPLEGMSDPERAQVEGMAVAYLWAWTLKAYRICEQVVRPCRAECRAPSTFEGWAPYARGSAGGGGPWPNPQLVAGEWTNVTCGACRGACGCPDDSFAVLRLPGPVASVSEVRLDGAVLDPDAYRVDNATLLV